ncbi:MAG: HD domain-containing protein [Spirochaetales bacterium]|nr:HD domain-containing protein [Spirochaetales bacterium]
MEKIDNSFEESVINLFRKIHPLERIERAGYVLRGVVHPETVAAHSHFLALLVLMVTEQYPGYFIKDRAVAMALFHDLPEAMLMDIPMPVSQKYFKEEKQKTEQTIFNELFQDFPAKYGELHAEFLEGKTDEAKLVAGLDKVQMMIKVCCYEREQRGCLDEFWENPANFRDHGIEAVSRLFDAVCRRAGRARPE